MSVQPSATSLARTCTVESSTWTTSARSRTTTPLPTASRRIWTASPVSDPMTRALPVSPASRVIMRRGREVRGPEDNVTPVHRCLSVCRRRSGVTAPDHRPGCAHATMCSRKHENAPVATSRTSTPQARCFPRSFFLLLPVPSQVSCRSARTRLPFEARRDALSVGAANRISDSSLRNHNDDRRSLACPSFASAPAARTMGCRASWPSGSV